MLVLIIIKKCIRTKQAPLSATREQRLSLNLLDEWLTPGHGERDRLNSVQRRTMTAACGLDKLQKHKGMSCCDVRFSLTWPERQSKAFVSTSNGETSY